MLLHVGAEGRRPWPADPGQNYGNSVAAGKRAEVWLADVGSAGSQREIGSL